MSTGYPVLSDTMDSTSPDRSAPAETGCTATGSGNEQVAATATGAATTTGATVMGGATGAGTGTGTGAGTGAGTAAPTGGYGLP